MKVLQMGFFKPYWPRLILARTSSHHCNETFYGNLTHKIKVVASVDSKQELVFGQYYNLY